ncbi:MAG: hypothetical protein WCB69_20430, partial [Pseudolabrys sp.]
HGWDLMLKREVGKTRAIEFGPGKAVSAETRKFRAPQTAADALIRQRGISRHCAPGNVPGHSVDTVGVALS